MILTFASQGVVAADAAEISSHVYIELPPGEPGNAESDADVT